MIRRVLSLAVLSAVVAGCSTINTQAISESAKAKVTSVSLNETVPYPPRMYYLGPGGATYVLFGAVGGLLAAPGLEKERQDAQAQASSGTSIDRIVYEETLAQLRASGKFTISERPNPDGSTIELSVTQYGFSIPSGFSSKLVPILRVKFELRDSSGQVLWTAEGKATPLKNPVEPVDPEEIMRNPSARETAWREAAKALAKAIVATY